MKEAEICKRLINSTIHVIAEEGIHKATTKAISVHSGINETNIYRFFRDKEDLLAKAFASLDCELVETVMSHIDVMYMDGLDFEIRCRFFFSAVWRFLLRNRAKCVAFIRYYYSPYFEKYSAQEHKARYLPILKKFEDAFRSEANIWMLLNHILNVMLDFAVKIFNNEVSDSDDTAEHVFLLIYTSVLPYTRN